MKDQWNIAQLNVANALYPLDDERMSRFVDQLDTVNSLADSSRGFIWRLQSDKGNATDIKVDDDPMVIVNMSVWQSVDALFNFAYKSAHQKVVADRRQWFKRHDRDYQVLWWVPVTHHPSVEEGMERLRLLREIGPSAEAFTFKAKYQAPNTDGEPENLNPEPFCVGWD